jgi:fibronectin-binding autotransporter adhesin
MQKYSSSSARSFSSIAKIHALAAIALALASANVHATSGTWTTTTASTTTWTNGANWSGGTVAGTNGTTNDQGTATFGETTTQGLQSISIDSGRNIQSINFGAPGNTTAGGAYTFTGSTLVLSAGGSITVNTGSSNSAGNVDFTNALTVLEGNYTFNANSTQPLLGFAQGGTLAWGTKALNVSIFAAQAGTLTLTGTNANGQAGYGASNLGGSVIFGSIGDNGGGNGTGGSLSILKSGTGTWALKGTSSYSGGTTIDGGVLNVTILGNINSVSSIGRGSVAGSASDLVFDGGTLQFTNYTGTSGSTSLSESTNRLFTIGDSTGTAPTATLDSSSQIGSAVNSNVSTMSFTGTGAIAYGSTGVAHGLTLTGSNLSNNFFDLQITDDSASDSTSLTKSGLGTWVLGNTASNSYSGNTTITGGVLRDQNGLGLSGNSYLVLQGGVYEGSNVGANSSGFNRSLGASGGGDLEVVGSQSGFSANGGALSVTIGTANSQLQFGSTYFDPQGGNNAFILNANTANNALTFNNGLDLNGSSQLIETNANTATITGVIGNSQSATTSAGLTKSGLGTLILTGTNTYNGGTSVSGGVLQVGTLGTLGTGAVSIYGGGELRLSGAGNVTAPTSVSMTNGYVGFGYNVTQGTGAAANTLGNVAINSSSTGGILLDGSNQSSALNMGTLGNNLYLGSATSGIYSAASLGAEGGGSEPYPTGVASFGGVYRLGAGGGTITFTTAGTLSDQPPTLLLNNNTGVAPGQSLSTSNNYNSVVIGDGSQAGQILGSNGQPVLSVVDFQADQSYSGTTTINAGAELNLDFSTGAGDNIINTTAPVTLQGGTLAVTGGAAVHAQTLAGLTTNLGTSTVSVTGTNATLNLGAITSNAGSTLVFNNSATTGGTITTSNTNLSTGQYIYNNGTSIDWAQVSGGTVGILTGEATLTTAATVSTNNYVVNNAAIVPAGSDTMNLLHLNETVATGTSSVALGTNSLITNGILLTGTGTGTISATTAAGTTNGITAAGNTLYLDNYSTGTLSVARITNNAAGAVSVVLGGNGTIALSATAAIPNTYTGDTYLDGATIALPAGDSEVNSSSLFVVNSGGFNFLGNSGSGGIFGAAMQWNGNFSLGAGQNVANATIGGLGNSPEFNGPVTLTNNITITLNNQGQGPWGVSGSINDGGYGYGLTVSANSPAGYNGSSGALYGGNAGLELLGTNSFTGALTVLNDGLGIFSTGVTNRNNVIQLGQNANLYLGATTIAIAGLQDEGTEANTSLVLGTLSGGSTLLLEGSGNYTYSGSIQNDVGVALTMDGTGTQNLTGANTFSKGVNANAGTLNIDAGKGGSIAATNALTLGGGTLEYEGTGSTTTFTGTTFSAGGSQVEANASEGNTTIALGALVGTGTAGAALDIDEIGTNGTDTVTTTTGLVTNGTYGAHVVFTNAQGFTSWATANTSVAAPFTIAAYTGGTALPTTTGSTALNYILSNSATQTQTGTTSIGLLQIDNTTGAGALDLHGQTLAVAGEGILFDGTSSYTIEDTSGSGSLRDNGLSDNELIIQNYGSKGTSLTIGASIDELATKPAEAVVFAGTGNTIITGTNSYTGATYLNGGVVTFNKMANFGTSPSLNFNGGTLQYASGFTGTNDLSVPGTGGRVINLGVAGGTIDTNGNTVTFASGNTIGNSGTGPGGLTYVDSANAASQAAANTGGVLNFNATSSYTGITTIGSGAVVNLGGGTGLGGVMATTGGTVVASGGTLEGGVTQATSAVQTTSGSYAGKLTLQAGGVIAPGALTAGANATINGAGLGAGNGNMASSVTLNVMQASQLTWQAGGKLSFLLDSTPNTASSLTDSANVPTGLQPSASTVLNLGTGALVKSGTGQFILSFNGTGGYNTNGVPNVYDLINFGATSLTGGLNGNTNFTVDDFTIQGLAGVGVLSFYDNTTADGHAGQEELLLTVIPEPSTWAMLIGGLATLIFWTRRKRATRSFVKKS